MNGNQLSCKVIEDLYPGYKDGLCSEETKQLVESHLAGCEACRRLYDDFPQRMPAAEPPEAKAAFRKLNRKLRIRRIFAVTGFILLLLTLIVFGLFCYAEGYIPLFGALRAQSRLSAYSGSRIHCTFDFYNAKYNSEGGSLSYTLHDDFIYDYAQMEDARNAMNESYAAFRAELEAEGLEPSEQLGDFSAINGKNFAQQFFRVYWSVWEPADMTDAESVKRIAELTQRLTAALPEYRITGIQFMYYNLNGAYQVVIPLSSEPLNSTKVTQCTQRSDEQHLPMDYMAWRREHRQH